MKKTALSLGAGMLLALGTAVADDGIGKVHCKVLTVTPANATFFNLIGPGPAVDSTIDLDLAAPEITDLTFSKGSINIKRVHAKLVRKQLDPPSPGFAYFEGAYRSPTSDYQGVLYGYDDGTNASVSIEVVRHQFNAGFDLNKLEMTCTHAF